MWEALKTDRLLALQYCYTRAIYIYMRARPNPDKQPKTHPPTRNPSTPRQFLFFHPTTGNRFGASRLLSLGASRKQKAIFGLKKSLLLSLGPPESKKRFLGSKNRFCSAWAPPKSRLGEEERRLGEEERRLSGCRCFFLSWGENKKLSW